MVTVEQRVQYLLGERSHLEDWEKELLEELWDAFDTRLQFSTLNNNSRRGSWVTDEEILVYDEEQNKLMGDIPY